MLHFLALLVFIWRLNSLQCVECFYASYCYNVMAIIASALIQLQIWIRYWWQCAWSIGLMVLNILVQLSFSLSGLSFLKWQLHREKWKFLSLRNTSIYNYKCKCSCAKWIAQSTGVSFMHFMAKITTMGTCGNCVVFRFTLCCPLNLNLYLFICCSWFVLWGSRWLVVHFHAGGKILSVWSGREKYGQHNRITSLVSAFLPCRDIPMGTHFCHANHTWISAGCFLSGHERREDGRKRCKMGKRDKSPWGIVMPEIHRAPSWTEVTIISWLRIVLVLIAFKD